MALIQVAVSSLRAPSLHLPLNTSPPSSAFQPLPRICLPSPLKTRPVRLQAASSGKYIRENYLVKKVSAKEVYDLIQGKRNVPLVIDFSATWCGPCILMAQDLEMLAVEYESNVMIVKVNTDDEYEFARDMQGLISCLSHSLHQAYFNPSKDAIRTEGVIPIEMTRKTFH